MEIKFLGTGGAFDYQYKNSSAVLTLENKTYLIDCGCTVYEELRKRSYTDKIQYIILTHLHNDHCGSLATLLAHFKLYHPGQKPVILYPSESFKESIHQFLRFQLPEPDKYVDFQAIQSQPNIKALDTYGLHAKNFQTYSYIFEEKSIRYAYSGDLGDANFLFESIKKMSEIPTTIFHDITFTESNVGHAFYKDLESHLEEFQIFGFHCNPQQSPVDNKIPLVYEHKEFLFH